MAMDRTITAGTARGLVNVNLHIWETNVEVADNRSYINFTVTITRGSKTWDTSWSGWGKKIYFVVTIDGNNMGTTYVPQYNYGGNNPPGTTFASGGLWITHNADGNRSISASIAFTDTANGNNSGSYYTPGNGSNSASDIALEWIPRTSNVSLSSSSLTTGSSVRIYTNRASTSFTHTISYAFGSASGTISTGVGDYVDWTPNRSLLLQIPTSTSGTGTITCITYSGSTEIGRSTANFTLNADSGVIPTITNASIQEGNSEVSSKNWGVYVQGKSYINTTFTINGVNGSTPSQYKCTIEGTEYVGSSLTDLNNKLSRVLLNTAGSRSLTLYGTDSRGRQSSATTKTYNVVAYSAPAITTYSVARCDSSGNIKDDGTYLKIVLAGNIARVLNGSTQKNPMTVKVGHKLKSASTYNYTTYVNASTSTYSVNYTGSSAKIYGGGNISANSTYDVIIEIIDGFTKISRTIEIGTGFDLIHYHSNGKALAIGKKSEATGSNALFEIGMDTKYKGEYLLEYEVVDTW